MLLATNQWPEDVREYFGDGDECHMAFHFPLMPRMYMAIAREDRHPIVEIMEQTQTYRRTASGRYFCATMTTHPRDGYRPRAGLPASDLCGRPPGAPPPGHPPPAFSLLENRHRGLMNLLLMSMPGSPIVYYGDEIGMGDDLQLGDYNGVRTPMQWLGGANGGFSTADPEQLFLPPST